MPTLPIDPLLPRLVEAWRDARAVVLSAATGSGKTTRVPPALLDTAPPGEILVVQPRRVAARASAAWVARQRGESVGDRVGHAVRFDRRGGPRTRLWFITPGVLLRRLVDDPWLDGVDTVVLDEVHERSLDLDLCLLLLAHVRREIRDDLGLIAMSATADTAGLSAFLDGAPVLDAPGRTFPVDIRHQARPDDRRLGDRVADGVRTVLAATDGDVLAFLPGTAAIRWTAQALGSLDGIDVLPLHGRLPPEAQDAVLSPGPRRRVVLATNLAETSLTIPGITGVVDSGLVHRLRHDARTGLDRLEREEISQASADQRAGRAGRTAPGVALRLWTQASHARRDPFEPPEVHRVDLSGALLQLRAFGEPDPGALRWLDPPSDTRRRAADALLQALGALEADRLTDLGRRMASLPLSPRAARALIEAGAHGVVQDTATALALLTERSPLRRDGPAPATSEGDLHDMVEAVARPGVQGWRPSTPGALRTVRQVADRLARMVPPRGRPSPDGLSKALLAGWPDRVARRRAPDDDGLLLVTGRGARLHPHSAVRDAPWLLALDVDGAGPEARVRLAQALDPSHLSTTEGIEVRWDPATDRAKAERVVRVGAIVLSRESTDRADDAAYTAALTEAATTAPPSQWLPGGREARGWILLRARVRFLGARRPDLGLPDVSDHALAHAIPQAAPRARRLADVARADWTGWLLGQLSWTQREALDTLAPERLAVASGSRIAVDYPEDDGPPVLAVRIQELFGTTSTPTIAGTPVLLHLLAPNGRPQQVTDDLDGFWDRAWPEVRKDLRGRYPKHSWPEDPRAASAEWRPGRRRPGS